MESFYPLEWVFPIAVAMLGLMVLSGTVGQLFHRPGRSYRMAALAGVLMYIQLILARSIVYSPERWSLAENAPFVRMGIGCLSAWVLIVHAVVYRSVRKELRRSLVALGVGLVPVLVVVAGLLLGVALLADRLLEVQQGLPYDLTLAMVAYLGPPIMFEFLMGTNLWEERGE